MSTTNGVPASEGPEDILRRRGTPQQRSALETEPTAVVRSQSSTIPNTPLAASIISFSLGGLFIFGVLVVLNSGLQYGAVTWQLGFFLAAWAAFHWGEFAVTAGWNREKCSVDCKYELLFCIHQTNAPLSAFLLENGIHYHLAHSFAILEYVLTAWLKPSLKTIPYVSALGKSRLCSSPVITPKPS